MIRKIVIGKIDWRQMMTDVIKKIDYKKVFHFFEEISNVPRGSRYNQEISDYLVDFAKQRNLCYTQDEALNVVIIKEASKGCESMDSVILQGHMDMVCLKEADSTHDFLKDPLTLHVDGDYIRANKTTLGGDNGIAIAYALAILDSDEFVHPRLEVIITTDEEIGLLGATALDMSSLKAKYMLNLDSEEESSLLVGCAGGMTSSATFTMEQEKMDGVEVKVCLMGLQGGHSGVDIAKNRTNATILSARLMMSLMKYDYSLSCVESGEKDNAIPSLSKLTFVVKEEQAKDFIASIEEFKEIFTKELGSSEPNFTMIISEGEKGTYACLTKESFKKVLYFITYVPNGIQTWSADIEGLVESSLNLGITKVDLDKALFSYSVRSSVATYKEYLSGKIEMFTNFLGGTYQRAGEYPAWEYKQDSTLRDICIELYEEEFKRKPIVETIHAGLECGVFSDRMPGLDIISIGPDMHDVHTPKERLSISSTIRVFDYIVKILERLSKC